MASSTVLSNHFKFELFSGNIDFDADTFKIILMDTGFVFDRDVHANYDDGLGADDVIDNELSGGNGYTTGGATLTGVTVTEDDTNDRVEVTWDNASWSASGGSIGPVAGAIIYNDTPSGDSNKTVIQYINFNGDITRTDGQVFTVTDLSTRGI